MTVTTHQHCLPIRFFLLLSACPLQPLSSHDNTGIVLARMQMAEYELGNFSTAVICKSNNALRFRLRAGGGGGIANEKQVDPIFNPHPISKTSCTIVPYPMQRGLELVAKRLQLDLLPDSEVVIIFGTRNPEINTFESHVGG
ncbi:hypothetical protein B0H14DRAFT_2611471 [Mycena olivaceomarginata]|nr:hypothetical protein B0H14DRAFT_2611471 [Mycena olivaceomarginata]